MNASALEFHDFVRLCFVDVSMFDMISGPMRHSSFGSEAISVPFNLINPAQDALIGDGGNLVD